MKKFMLAVGLLSLAGGAFAAGKPCEDLKYLFCAYFFEIVFFVF